MVLAAAAQLNEFCRAQFPIDRAICLVHCCSSVSRSPRTCTLHSSSLRKVLPKPHRAELISVWLGVNNSILFSSTPFATTKLRETSGRPILRYEHRNIMNKRCHVNLLHSEVDTAFVGYPQISQNSQSRGFQPHPFLPLRRKTPSVKMDTRVIRIGNESVPIQLAQCWFTGLDISNAKI